MGHHYLTGEIASSPSSAGLPAEKLVHGSPISGGFSNRAFREEGAWPTLRWVAGGRGVGRESQVSVRGICAQPSRVRRHTIPKSRRRSADARGAPGAASPRLCSAPRATTTDRLVQVARSVALSSRRIIVVVLAACVLVAGIVAFRLNRQVDRALDAAVSISLARIDDNVSADHVSPLKKPPRDGKRPRTVKLVNTNGTLISSVHERYARRLGKQGQRQ